MKKTSKEIIEENKALFLSKWGGNPPLKLLYFHAFLCPVAFAEAKVKERISEDYDALELLVLRLYDAGFHYAEQISSLSGMKRELIERALFNEINVYHHINETAGVITVMGRESLAAGEKHIVYETPRRFQIEAATGTVIPRFLEDDNVKHLRSFIEERDDGVVPKEAIEYDEDVRNEINARLAEYKRKDVIGDEIEDVISVHTNQMYYRWAYLVKFEGMSYPMVVMQGYKSIDQSNRESIKKGKFGERMAIPLAISETDYDLLYKKGMVFDETLKRADKYFAYLDIKTKDFKFAVDQADIRMENEEAVYEDEKVMEYVDSEENFASGDEEE